jgi:hypothetical protein
MLWFNQRPTDPCLWYNKIYSGTFKYGEIIQIKPKFFLGTGTVEIKEIIDFMKQ